MGTDGGFQVVISRVQLEDELFVEAGSDVMVGRVFERRRTSG